GVAVGVGAGRGRGQQVVGLRRVVAERDGRGRGRVDDRGAVVDGAAVDGAVVRSRRDRDCVAVVVVARVGSAHRVGQVGAGSGRLGHRAANRPRVPYAARFGSGVAVGVGAGRGRGRQVVGLRRVVAERDGRGRGRVDDRGAVVDGAAVDGAVV